MRKIFLFALLLAFSTPQLESISFVDILWENGNSFIWLHTERTQSAAAEERLFDL